MNSTAAIVIGTRASKLALWQTRHVHSLLKKHFPETEFEIKTITTTGDKILDSPLAQIGDKGLFTKEIEIALQAGEIDLAVHSLKDIPTELPEGLKISAILEREDPRDALVSKGGARIETLPPGASVATSSLRRRAQLLSYRPDLQIEDIRGNVDTRLRKLAKSDALSAIVLAKAGLVRMGLENRISQVLGTDVMLPAVGQGALAVETREGDSRIIHFVSALDHAPTRACVLAERTMLAALEGGCQVPIGALGRVENGRLCLEGVVASLQGSKAYRGFETGLIEQPEQLGRSLAARLLEMGASQVLEEINLKFRCSR